MIETLSDLLLVLVQRLAITYPDGEVSRRLDAVATASDLLVVLVPGDDGVGLAEDDTGHVDRRPLRHHSSPLRGLQDGWRLGCGSRHGIPP